MEICTLALNQNHYRLYFKNNKKRFKYRVIYTKSTQNCYGLN